MSELEESGTTVTTTIATTVSGRNDVFVTEYVDDSYRAYPLTSIYTPQCNAIFRFSEFETECEPPDFDPIWREDGYYSPGICYSGYTAGCSMTWRDLKPGQTAYNCVPIYTFQAASINDDGDELTAPAVEIRWESSDLSFLETHPLTPEALTTDSSATGNPGTGSQSGGGPEVTGELEPADTGGGVPTGAVAGIAVGAAAFVAVLCGAAFIWYRKRRQRRDNPPAPDADASSTEKPGGPVLYGGPPAVVPPAQFPVHGPTGPPAVIPVVMPTELAGTHYHTSDGAAELHGRDLLPELPPAEVHANPASGNSPSFQLPRRPVPGEAETGT